MSSVKTKAAPRRANHAQRDGRLVTSIQAYARHHRGIDVHVDANDGFVTLTGSVRTFRQKERLHRFIMRMHGVRALKDVVRVWPVESVADREVALHVRNALDAHAELPRGTAAVHVRSGVVTLDGHMRTADERAIAETVASHCRGVSAVINHLTVDPLDEVTDEAAAGAVRRALAYCREFETAGVTVSCSDGEVVLRGEVPTLLDRLLAEEVARLQGGVRSVENHLHVSNMLAEKAAGKR
jgi:osmotically-inducible protein OsmY